MSVLCVGDDGHVAIEVLLEGDCGDCVHYCQWSDFDSKSKLEFQNSGCRRCGDCVDIPLNLGVMEKSGQGVEGRAHFQPAQLELGSMPLQPASEPFRVKPLFGCGPPGSSLILRSSITSVRLLI